MIYKKVIQSKGKQKGIMLIEVMLSAVLLTLGSIAFLKLQRVGLQSGFNDYARTQSVAIARGFSDSLRSNIGFVDLDKTKKTGFIFGKLTVVKPPQSDADCKSEHPGKVCSLAAFNYHRYLTNLHMLNGFKAKQSLLCYRESNDKKGYMRITALWRDNSSDKTKPLSGSSCPNKFDAQITEDFKSNSVTIYVQL